MNTQNNCVMTIVLAIIIMLSVSLATAAKAEYDCGQEAYEYLANMREAKGLKPFKKSDALIVTARRVLDAHIRGKTALSVNTLAEENGWEGTITKTFIHSGKVTNTRAKPLVIELFQLWEDGLSKHVLDIRNTHVGLATGFDHGGRLVVVILIGRK